MPRKSSIKSATVASSPDPSPSESLGAETRGPVPMPLRHAAPVTAKSILEHAYWLGDAIKADDAMRISQEIEAFKVLCKMYNTFASKPDNKLPKYGPSSMAKKRVPKDSSKEGIPGQDPESTEFD